MTMKTYEGTKRLMAVPMNRLNYNAYRGWILPANEDGADEGYLVEYLDGGSVKNHHLHDGYISWSPKDVFERTYKELVPPPYQQRVLEEREELATKITRLGTYIGSHTFAINPPVDWQLLIKQLGLMKEYLQVLDHRIAGF